MLDYNDLNDSEKRILRDALGIARINQYYLEDNNIMLMKTNELFEYIFLDEIDKLKQALEFINIISKTEIKEQDKNKNIAQILLERNEKVIKITDEIFAYKDN